MLLFKYRDVDVPQGACKSSGRPYNHQQNVLAPEEATFLIMPPKSNIVKILDSPLQIIEQAVGLGVGLTTKAPVSKQEFSFS